MNITRIVPCLFALVPALAGESSAEDANSGAAESHNPIDKGSVWAALGNAARYGHCIDERRYAKRWFREISSTES